MKGEALLVKWSLEDTRFFTWGCKDLHIQTDHRPLVKLLGCKHLDDIENSRMLSFIERTIAWKFRIKYYLDAQSLGLIPLPEDQEIQRSLIMMKKNVTGNEMGVHAIEIFMLDTNEQDDLEISVIALLKQSLAQ